MKRILKAIYNKFFQNQQGLSFNDVKNQFLSLSVQDRLKMADFTGVKLQLDYESKPIFLHVSTITEFPRIMACKKEPMTVRWLEKYLSENDVFYDIGANVGAYALLAASLLRNNTKVFAFEPSFLNYGSLCKNILINNMGEAISAFPLAITNKTQLNYFNYANLNVGGALHTLGEQINYRGDHYEAAYRQPVMAFSLDDLISLFGFPVPNHIKIDVDGTEMNVLEGAERTLENSAMRTMMIEICELRVPAATIQSYLFPKGWIMAERYDRPGKPGQSSDVSYLLFVRSHA